MTWACTDCGADVPATEIHEHMQHVHGVNYAAPMAACPSCEPTKPCKRVGDLMGRD